MRVSAVLFRHTERRSRSSRLASATPAAQTEILIPIAARAREVLRAILRECTYLPDAQARSWLAHETIDKFRRARDRLTRSQSEQIPTAIQRVGDKLCDEERLMRRLQRANHGDRQALLDILLRAYGRKGRRRRELMNPLLVSHHVVCPPKSPPDALQATTGGNTTVQRSVELSPVLRALATSQGQVAPSTLTRPNPRTIEPSIPTHNSYMRPMPESRVLNMMKKWRASFLDKILPPLPQQEWDRLHSLASGRAEPVSLLASRRSRAGILHECVPGEAKLLERVIAHGKLANPIIFHQHRSRITPRFMRRLYAQVFEQCPRVEWNSIKDSWMVAWGARELYSMKNTATAQPAPEAST